MDDSSVDDTPGEVQSLSDIQSYLATFNKEIGDGRTSISSLGGEQLLAQAQAANLQVTTQVITNVAGTSALIQGSQASGEGLTLQQNASGQIVTHLGSSMMLSSQAGQLEPHFVEALSAQGLAPAGMVQETGADGQPELVLNTGSAYQTVTIVPTSEVNQAGELSYVLIVSPPDEDKNADLSVFDFKEEKGDDMDDDMDADENCSATTSPSKLKFAPRRVPTLTQLMCNYCNYTSPKRYLLTRHMKTHSEERPHKCHICDRGFKTIASLQNHINTHTGVKPHKCKECDAAFTTSGELVRHVRYRHTFEKPHKCTECDYASVELSKLKRHIRSHTGERPYQCPHCSYSSPDTFKLKRHLRIHTGEKPYECDICHARFTQSNSLKAHRMIHTGEKPVYQCELCPTTCGRKTDLKIHVQKLHTSEKPIQCKKCGKAFPDRYTYKIHLKTHDGEKCFRCELCPYAALSQRHLESHILTHTGEKPFRCEECDMSFRQKQLLRRHKNIYHTPEYIPPVPKEKRHTCVECGKTFAHKGNLLRHMLLHDPDNPLYQEMALKVCDEDEGEEDEGQTDMRDETGMNDDSDISGDETQVQMRLVESDNTQGNIYVEHQGGYYQLQLGDNNTQDGTIVVSEPGTSAESHPTLVKLEEDGSMNTVSFQVQSTPSATMVHTDAMHTTQS